VSLTGSLVVASLAEGLRQLATSNSSAPDSARDSGSAARAGADLHLDLAPSRGRGDLVCALHGSIRTGRLPPGTRLPSSRSLAKDLGIARNTVADAYGQLVAEGWLSARQGSGTVVARREAPAPQFPGHCCGAEAALRPVARVAAGFTFPRTC
jgi:GntR family transcriptional regulator/MocR family aminotransferase